ncbi:MAG TPA: terminase family protein [Methylomirabilota bacterium]|nr:terminase family protein [Methylomirabilota bacterium]
MEDALAYAAEVVDEWERRVATDALRHFRSFPKAHPKQQQFVEDDDTREVLLLGANRSGKTIALCARVARRLRSGAAKLIWIVSPSNAMSRQNIVPQLYEGAPGIVPFIPETEIAQVRTSPDWEVIGHEGWRCVLKSCEQGRDKFAGAAIDEVDYDEPPTWPIYNECAIRFGAGSRVLVRMAATLLPPPGQSGGVCQWLWSEKIEPWLHKRLGDDTRIINVSMADNPYITEEQLGLARRLYAPGSLDYRIRILGELLPGLIGARCYSGFERRLHVNKTLGPPSIDPMRPLYVGVDVNVDPLCAIIMQQHGKIWRALDEIVLRPGTLGELGDTIRERFSTHRHEIVLCGDAMAEHRHAQTGKTDYEVLLAAMAGGPRVRLAVPPQNPPDRNRVNLVNFLLGAAGAPVRLEVAPGCVELIADLEQVLWSRDGGHINKSHKRDDPYYQRTHISDAMGYILFLREAASLTQATRIGQPKRAPIPPPAYGFQREQRDLL